MDRQLCKIKSVQDLPDLAPAPAHRDFPADSVDPVWVAEKVRTESATGT